MKLAMVSATHSRPVAVTALSAGMLAFLAGCGSQSPASKLASLDCGCRPTAVQIAPYRAALAQLRGRCSETPKELVAAVELGHAFVKKYGIRGHVTSLLMLQAVYRFLRLPTHGSPPNGKWNCTGLLGASLVATLAFGGGKRY